MNAVPTVDLSEWKADDVGADAIVRAVDEGLKQAGFLLIKGHGVRPGLADEVRSAARRFFALPDGVKAQYATRVGGRGYIGPGLEANGSSEGVPTPADLKETFAVGPESAIGDADDDKAWFKPNVWPVEVSELRELVVEYTAAMRAAADEVLAMFTAALGFSVNPFSELTERPTWTCNINHYPSLEVVGSPEPGQFRIGPHTDFGIITLLDRECGAGGLQVFTDAAGWQDAPFDPDALTVNIGDLLEYWSGRRWQSGRHRVLPPQDGAPEEDLVSLIYFYDLDHDAIVEPCVPPIGAVGGLESVRTSDFIRARLNSITVG